MPKKKRLAKRVILNTLKRIRDNKMVRNCVARLFEQAGSDKGSQDIPGICSRALKAKPLMEEIGKRLRQTNDPDERIDLFASLTTLQHLIQKGADIPGSLDELMSLEDEMHCAMHGSDPGELERLLMSTQMLIHAARSEKEEQPN
jgi:hypothetical protein